MLQSPRLLEALTRRVQGNRLRKNLAIALGLDPTELSHWTTGSIRCPKTRIRDLAEALLRLKCPLTYVQLWVGAVHAEWSERTAARHGYGHLLPHEPAPVQSVRRVAGGSR